MSANREDKGWEGIPCVLPDWIYTADLGVFEARQTIKRQKANYFADVVGLDASETEEAEILKLIRTARDAANAARTAEHELVAEARAMGISLKDIGNALGLKEAGVSMYLKRAPLTAERQERIGWELLAWDMLTKLWAREIESDEPGESFFLHGVNQLLYAQQHFEQCIQLQMTGRNPTAAIQKLRSTHDFVHYAFESFTDPQIPQAIAKYTPKRRSDEAVESGVIPGTATAYIRHGIFEVVLAKVAFHGAIEKARSRSAQGPPDSMSPDIMLFGTCIASALVSLSRPEAMFVSDEMIEFLRREHPYLLASETLSMDQITMLHKRRFGSDDLDDTADTGDLEFDFGEYRPE